MNVNIENDMKIPIWIFCDKLHMYVGCIARFQIAIQLLADDLFCSMRPSEEYMRQ